MNYNSTTFLANLRDIAEKAQGTTRINWNPADALEVIARLEFLEKDVEQAIKIQTSQMKMTFDADLARAKNGKMNAESCLAEREKQLANALAIVEAMQPIVEAALAYREWVDNLESNPADTTTWKNLQIEVEKYRNG